MARSNTTTTMPLDRWAELIGMNPVHFNGCYSATQWPVMSTCDFLWTQHTWQSPEQYGSRDTIANLIRQAEAIVHHLVGYSHTPFIFSERMWWNKSGVYQTKLGHITGVGQYTRSLISTESVVYSDEDNDNFDETATVTATVPSGTLGEELSIHFTSFGGGITHEIRPVTITVSGTTATFVAKRWQMVEPALHEQYPVSFSSTNGIDLDDDDSVVDTVDVYRTWLEEDTITLTLRSTCIACGDVSHDFTVEIVEPNAGIFKLVPTSCTYHIGKHSLPFVVEYKSGYERNETLEDVIVMIVMARIANPPCTCSAINAQYAEHRINVVQRDRYVDPTILSNPIGLHAGEVLAYNTLISLGIESQWTGVVL